MKTCTFILLLTSALAHAQSVDELNKRRGFKNIRLDFPTDSIKGLVFEKDIQERNEFSAKLFRVDHPDYATIGGVKVKEIKLKSFQDQVYQIQVITAKDPRIMQGLEKAYGRSTYSIRSETYYWKGDSISLVYKAHGKHAISLIYSSSRVHRLMMKDKTRQIEEVAEDF
ncbi:MAG: hypothetical protein ACK5DD_03400 [Cyclobacteriaceae bacterium]